jgi:hypothetical protein
MSDRSEALPLPCDEMEFEIGFTCDERRLALAGSMLATSNLVEPVDCEGHPSTVGA